MRSIIFLCGWGILLFSGVTILSVHATRTQGTCTDDSECVWVDSVCDDNGYCTNPFEKGCLRAMAKHRGHDISGMKERVCNSDDNAVLASGASGASSNRRPPSQSCTNPPMEYFEVRISPGYWESATVLGWIFQIVLSEVFDVPATIEGDTEERTSKFSFYAKETKLDLPNSIATYPFHQLVEADKVKGMCGNAEKPCAHLLTEVWQGGKNDAIPLQENGTILKSEPNGYSGRFGFYVPLHTVQRDGSLASYHGYQGEENKRKLAENFKTPTNWNDYCSLISESKCEFDDGIASRAPISTKEENSYYVQGTYKGHFRTTFQNNCTANVNCTGSAISHNCDGTVYTESQFYWNDIRLSLDGPEAPTGSYNYSHIIQIYEAANATKSDVFLWFYEPDLLFEKYAIIDGMSMKRVDFPNPTMECYSYRQNHTKEKRCSEIKEERVGTSEVSGCDFSFESLPKLFSRGIINATYASEEAIRSPAYDYLKNLVIPQLTMPTIFRNWQELERSGKAVDVARETVCSWVYDNLDDILLKNKPKGYPRTFKTVDYTRLSISGYSMGSITFIAAIITAALTYRWRDQVEIKAAQVQVLYMVTIGHAFIALGGITGASKLTDATCVMTQWFTRLGYTLSLVPILVKISAINKLKAAARRLKKVEINRTRFRNIVVMAMSALLVFLALWTIVDRPRMKKDYRIDGDEGLVQVHIGCSSKFNAWERVAFGWEFVLLLSATVLTFQSRDVIQGLNESHWLAFMVYSHFVFVILRIVTNQLMLTDLIPSALSLRINSLLLSVDALLALLIYFGPKFSSVMTRQDPNHFRSTTQGSSRFPIRRISGLNVPLTGSGNIPNLVRRRRKSSTTFDQKLLFSANTAPARSTLPTTAVGLNFYLKIS